MPLPDSFCEKSVLVEILHLCLPLAKSVKSPLMWNSKTDLIFGNWGSQ